MLITRFALAKHSLLMETTTQAHALRVLLIQGSDHCCPLLARLIANVPLKANT
jgi:streptomycin 6-kinase